MNKNRQVRCPKCGTTNYGVVHSCLKCGAPLPQPPDSDKQPEIKSPSRFEAPTIIDAPPELDAYIEFTSGADLGNRYALVSGLTFGRSRDCDIVIESPKASREHARIERDQDNNWQLVDLGSTNGTYHNNRMISAPVLLRNGDKIAICDSQLRIHLKRSPQPPPAPEPEDTGGLKERRSTAPKPQKKRQLSNTTIVITVVVILLIFACTAGYIGIHFALGQGWL